MSNRTRTAIDLFLGTFFGLLGLCLLFGCVPGADILHALAGTPATTSTDGNGVTIVVTPAVPGIVSPVVESVATFLAAVGMPILALWIRAVGKGAKATAETVRNGNTPTPHVPPDAPA